MLDPQVWADTALFAADAMPTVEQDRTMTLTEAAAFIRLAYGRGWLDAQEEPRPLSVEEARVQHARLRLDLPD
jgi:hypothetical protein